MPCTGNISSQGTQDGCCWGSSINNLSPTVTFYSLFHQRSGKSTKILKTSFSSVHVFNDELTMNSSNIRFLNELLAHRQYDHWENEANSEAVIVDGIFPWLHGVVLKAHRLVPAGLAQFFVVEEDYTHSDLFQPDDTANEPGCTHRAERSEPATKNERRVRGWTFKVQLFLCIK